MMNHPHHLFRTEDFAQWAQNSGFVLDVRDVCVSTNSELLAAARGGGIAPKTLLLAHRQSGGRGRMGRGWENAAYAFTFTLGRILPPSAAPAVVSLPAVAAAACCRVLRNEGVPLLVKWPNDLVIGTKKAGGILVETLPETRGIFCAVGVGINLTAPQNVPLSAGIMDYLPHNFHAARLLENLWTAIDSGISRLTEQGFAALRDEYLAFSRDLGKEVCLLRDGKNIAQGCFAGIDGQGGLILRDKNGVQKTFFSGDISLRLPEK